MSVNRQILLRTRPEGLVGDDDFEHIEKPVPEPGEGDALIRTTWLSLDPTNRLWMREEPTYFPPVGLGEVMRGIGIGQVISSTNPELPEGAMVAGMVGWQDYILASEAMAPFTVIPEDLPVDVRHMLGVLGHTGMTAYFGLTDIGKPQPGETVVISAAAGAVGSVTGQMVKAMGARAVGLAGTAEKCRMVVEDLGFDACICYRDEDWREQLAAACPDGIDVDWESAGGEILDHMMGNMNLNGRIVICGLIAEYNDQPNKGVQNFDEVIMKRLTIGGFVVLDHMTDRGQEAVGAIAGLMAEGKIKPLETLTEGLETAPMALNRLYEGDNVGKLLIKVADPPL
ncbi:MAG: hypothetical protein QOG62_1247 [Thermoleophilaceae bacterium]|nr:hypothetical protein [Thermoleophilaceae bacterium]